LLRQGRDFLSIQSLDPRQGRRLFKQVPAKAINLILFTTDMYLHPLRIVPYRPPQTAFTGQVPNGRTEPNPLHQPLHTDTFSYLAVRH
jgi:hypothetical protein